MRISHRTFLEDWEIIRRLFAFDPVGNGNSGSAGNIVAYGRVGNVTVTT